MNKYFVTFEQALALKELGFDEPCLALFHWDEMFVIQQTSTHEQYYGQACSAPLYSQVFEWFRNNHLLEATINRSWSMHSSYHYVIINNMDYDNAIQQESTSNRTYQQAKSACLDELIKIVKTC